MNRRSDDAAADLDVAAVCAELQLPDVFLEWLRRVEGPDQAAALVLPSNLDADALLQRLAVERDDRVATLAARPDPIAHPALWWVLERIYHDVVSTMGIPPAWGGWPAFPAYIGPVGRHLYVWLCLAVLPQVREYHQHLGIADDISWASLAVLGRETTKTRVLSGIPGLESNWMLPRTFRGAAYSLGRLVFERGRPEPSDGRHEVLRPGEISLGTHIPGTGERLDPIACDDSFSAAHEFFAGHFDEPPAAFDCHSWLMDDQLIAYLPATSNIIQFQRRFTYFNDSEPGDQEILEHIFLRRYHESQLTTQLLDELPQDTDLQRAIVAHLRTGSHWHNRTGWLRV